MATLSERDRDESASFRAAGQPPPESNKVPAGRWYESRWAKIIGLLAAVLTIPALAYQYGPLLYHAALTRGLNEADRAELSSWARETARDGVITDAERASLEGLISRARLREKEVRTFIVGVQEQIQESADLVRQGAALVERGEFRRASEYFLLATSRDPKNAQGWVNLGAAKLELGFLNEAEIVLRRALELEPDRWTAHYNLAASLAANGNQESALHHLERSIELAGDIGLSESEKQSLRRDLSGNRWLDSLRELPRFEALLGHPAIEAQGI